MTLRPDETFAGRASLGPGHDSSTASGRRPGADRLRDNDLLQARLLITSGPRDALELADALLARIADQDPRGEVAFYRAVSLIRQRGALPDILALLEDAAEQRHPHALALLYKIHNEPYLAPRADRARALRYRQAYAELNVAKSGYPSFPRALMVVDQLVNPPRRWRAGRAAAPDAAVPAHRPPRLPGRRSSPPPGRPPARHRGTASDCRPAPAPSRPAAGCPPGSAGRCR